MANDGSKSEKSYTNYRGLILCMVLWGAMVPSPGSAEETALDRYVAKPDEHFAWSLDSQIQGDGYAAFVLNFTSQKWRSEDEVDRPIWKHWLTIVRPDGARYETAMLYIGGGRNGDAAPTKASERAVRLALATGSVVAELGMVPNQPLHFADSDKHPRYEDDLIAYSRIKSIISGDDEWLVRLPMVKSATRALDAMSEFMATEDGGAIELKHFVIAGGSKRGWVTWLVGAVDPRVVAIVPIVIDALNTEVVTRKHFAAYGFFSPSLGDYVRHGLYPGKLGSPEFAHILAIEDPYMYRDRPAMRLPKYIVNASGDQYFLPDNSQLYFAGLAEEKHLRYVPNAKHNLAGSDALDSIAAFYQTVLDGRERPKFSWEIRGEHGEPDESRQRGRQKASIVVTLGDQHIPNEVNLWQATNPEARDFRLDVIGKSWTSSPLDASELGRYVAELEAPPAGFTASFIELVYDSGGATPLKFTTDVKVVPDVLPFEGAEMKAIMKPQD